MGSKPPFIQIAMPISTHCAIDAVVRRERETHRTAHIIDDSE
jgi:hypothetical protein